MLASCLVDSTPVSASHGEHLLNESICTLEHDTSIQHWQRKAGDGTPKPAFAGASDVQPPINLNN
eukprot:5283700-Amphidinium_carterae.1